MSHNNTSNVSKPRTVIITGANKGIGYHLIESLLSNPTPYNIILTARSTENGEKAIAQLRSTYSSATSTVTFRQLDIDNADSIEAFTNWVKNDLGTFDVLVDNAGVLLSPEDVPNQIATIHTNFINTVNLTEKLLPYLSKDGKIIVVSSVLGSLVFQSKKIGQTLTDPSNTTEKLLEVANKLIENYKEKSGENELGFTNKSYHASKSLLNAYVRWALIKKVTNDQQVFSVCPGWCQTDMGGATAYRTPQKGAETLAYLINIPFKADESINGKFWRDEKVIGWDFIDEDHPEFLGTRINH